MDAVTCPLETLTPIRTDPGAIFIFFGTEPFEMADHLVVARWRREDVQTCGGGWRCR